MKNRHLGGRDHWAARPAGGRRRLSFERLEDRRLLSLAPLAVWLPSDRPPESPIQTELTGLAPATYTVAEVLPEQHEQTFPAGSQGSGRLTFQRMHRDGQDGVDGLDGAVAVAMSPDGGPDGWDLAPQPTCLAVRDGQGTGGCDRVTVIWADGAIQKQWLQVTVLANSSTGLDEPDVFYFGNAVGESGNSTAEAKVNAYDMLGARDNQRTFADLAPLDFPYDYNRDARVNAYDVLIARDNQTHFLNALKLITIPMVGQGTCPTIGRDGEGTGLPVFSGVEIPPATPARLDWLYELDQISAHRQPAERDKSAEPITDAWLAAFHCG